jgi:hypothetical protein
LRTRGTWAALLGGRLDIEDGSEGVALDELLLALRGLAQGSGGEAIEVAQKPGGCLVETFNPSDFAYNPDKPGYDSSCAWSTRSSPTGAPVHLGAVTPPFSHPGTLGLGNGGQWVF